MGHLAVFYILVSLALHAAWSPLGEVGLVGVVVIDAMTGTGGRPWMTRQLWSRDVGNKIQDNKLKQDESKPIGWLWRVGSERRADHVHFAGCG